MCPTLLYIGDIHEPRSFHARDDTRRSKVHKAMFTLERNSAMRNSLIASTLFYVYFVTCQAADAQVPQHKGDYVCDFAFNLQVPKEGITYVSLVQLVANPDRYDGKLVCVAGFFDPEYEAATLYLHEDDYHNTLVENGIWVDLQSTDGTHIRPLSQKYVWMLGRFRAGPLFGPPAIAPGPPSNLNVVGGLTKVLGIAEIRSNSQSSPPIIWVRPGIGTK
jgi:hypothetical protein